MFKILVYIGLALFVPGLCVLGYSLYEGPSAWMTDSATFWGTPISLFVFWIGLAHAGTLLSAIFLALDVKLDRRTAMLAELSTICCLVIAALFPLMHLGVLERFYMVVPFLDARANVANVRSPLVWDFCCIAVYGILSTLFFVIHISARKIPGFDRIRRPMAWLLFPLVLWVHTVVSLDFASTYVPQWTGAYFPLYFIIGAIFSGLAMMNCILWTEGYRMRLLEKMMLVGSWIIAAIWFWEFLLKGSFDTGAFVFAALFPQLLLVKSIRELRVSRLLISISILIGLLLERINLVSPGQDSVNTYGLVDLGLVSFSFGAFLLFFFIVRRRLAFFFEDGGSYFGEVDSRDMVQEELKSSDSGMAIFRVLRTPLLAGFALAVLYGLSFLGMASYENISLSLANYFPMTYPLIALVAGVWIFGWEVHKSRLAWSKKRISLIAAVAALMGLSIGLFYGGGSSESLDTAEVGALLNSDENPSGEHSALVWNARCATCHGVDGTFNRKFVNEFYPVPQKLDVSRLESLGEDSLVSVVLRGRTNMNAYGGRLSEGEARGLVRYMKSLAEKQNHVEEPAEKQGGEP